MSWWDSGSLGGFGQALKSAQKKIDKVLDIKDGTGGSGTRQKETKPVPKAEDKPVDEKEEKKEEGDFWNNWGINTSMSRWSAEKDDLESPKPSSSSKSEPESSKESSDSSLLSSFGTEWSEVLASREKKKSQRSTKRSSDAKTPEQKASSSDPPKPKGPLKLGSKKVVEDETATESPDPSGDQPVTEITKDDQPLISEETEQQCIEQPQQIEEVPHSDAPESQEGDTDPTSIEPPVAEGAAAPEPASTEQLEAPVVATGGPPGSSDWSDLSLSILTESQMSTGSNAGISPTVRDVKDEQEEKKEEEVETAVPESVAVEVERNAGFQSEEVERTVEVPDIKTDSEEKEVKSEGSFSDKEASPDPSESSSSNNQGPESSVDSLVIKPDSGMDGSHESGDLSDSNRTITGEDNEDEEDGEHPEQAPEAEQKQTEDSSSESENVDQSSSAQVESSSIQTITETSSCPSDDQSPSSSEIQPKSDSEGSASEAKTGDSDKNEMSSSGYVKNMLEEAMVESVKDTDSHAGSSFSSVDMVKIESGQNSGHCSADEIETTTSSDIEIISHISTPTSNGEYRVERPFDLSPLRHALGRSMTRRTSPPGHRRNDSGSSIVSFQSGNGADIVSPPGMMRHPEPPDADCVAQVAIREESMCTAGEMMVAEAKMASEGAFSADKLLKKLADTAELLDAREKKLLELSRENVGLVESNNVLKNLLKDAEEAREAEQTDLYALTEEFTKRIAEAEKRIHQSQKEKESAKKRCTELESELDKRSDTSTATDRALREKDEQIAELLEEGEKLSKQQLQSNNIIKKLRAKEKENDTIIKSQKEKVESQKSEIERLQKILDNKCDIEQKQIDAINQLNTVSKKQAGELERLRGELEDAMDKARSTQAALDNSYKEIGELHKAAAAAASEQNAAALSAEKLAKQQLQAQLDRQEHTARQEQEALVTQIEDLRLSLSRQEKEHGRREDVLRQEISDLQQRLQEAEERNQELTQSVSAATRPLLRQIENLQSTYAAQSTSYEKVERNLTDRLAEAQQSAAAAVEKERSASEALLEASSRLSSLESQSSGLRQDKSRLSAQLEVERARAEMMEDSRNTDVAQVEAAKQRLERELAEARRERTMLDNQLEMEKMKVEAEKKKLVMAHEQLRDKELQLSQVRAVGSSPTPSVSGKEVADPMAASFSSMTGSLNLSQDEGDGFLASPHGHLRGGLSLYDTLRQNSAGGATILENLQSQLKQKDGEIAQLQSEIVELERTREAMARELVTLANQNDDLELKLKDYPEFQEKHSELDQRYNALLQMYGEKVEEADELRLDLQDVKEMYKGQIEELLKSRSF